MSTIDDRFRHVATGLKLIYASLVLLVLLFVGGFVGGIFIAGRAAPGAGAVELSPLLLGLLALGILATILGIVGKIYCLDVPEKVKATGVIYTAVALSVVSVCFDVAKAFPSIAISLGPFATIGNWLGMAANILFLVFLGRLAEFLGSPKLVARARFVLFGSIFAGVSFLVLLFGLPLVVFAPQDLAKIVGVASIVIGIFALVLFVSYANLISELQRTLDRMLLRRTME
jgi:hypothetical protein